MPGGKIQASEDESCTHFAAADCDDAKKRFSITLPALFNFGFDAVDRHAAGRNRRALIWVDAAGKETREYSFQDIARLSNQAANASGAQG